MQKILRELPQIDKLVQDIEFDGFNKHLITKLAKEYIASLRDDILNKKVTVIDKSLIIKELKELYIQSTKPSLKPLINATGVILHTNMGRCTIDKEILERASRVICNYSNLEYKQKEGKRGDRYSHISKLLSTLLGVEDALVVNNNASAVFLILNTFAKGKEAIVSRGELVEIGGSFRIPEVMANSGAILQEVGTTNKTKATDYTNAISKNSSIIMKVHKSNYEIVGFSQEVPYKEIIEIAKEHNLIDYYDLGSGYIAPLPYGLSNTEDSIFDILKHNPSLISFSGDKLFGSAQAGIIVGKKALINKLKSNQLLRMLRVDKITLSLLEETIKVYLEEQYDLIPTLKLLNTPLEVLEKRALNMQEKIGKERCQVLKTTTVIGGGTLPNKEFPTIALHIFGKASKLERIFREKDIIGRIEQDKFLIDFRALDEGFDGVVVEVIQAVLH